MNVSPITRRAIESAVCAVLAGGTLAGIAAAGTMAPTATAHGAQFAPVAATTAHDTTATRRRIALRWLAAHLPACEHTSGNGRGDSFVDIAGTAYYFRPAAGGVQ